MEREIAARRPMEHFFNQSIALMSEPPEPELSDLVSRASTGDLQAGQQLVERLYGELHVEAVRAMRRQSGPSTLQPTALVNEAWLKLMAGGQGGFESRNHFMAAAAQAMRWIVIDHARKKGRLKNSASGVRVPLEGVLDAMEEGGVDLLALGEALDALKEAHPDLLPIVELRFFAGLEMKEVAEVRGVSLRTCERDWTFVKSWLGRQLVSGNR